MNKRNIEAILFNLFSMVLSVTGLVYLYFEYFYKPKDEFAVVSSPLQPWMIKLHVLFSPLFVFMFAVFCVKHVFPMLEAKVTKLKRSGLLLLVFIVALVMSGYFLQSFSQLQFIDWVKWAHVVLGVLFMLALMMHLKGAKKIKNMDVV